MIVFLLILGLVVSGFALFLATLAIQRQAKLEPMLLSTFAMLRVWADTWPDPQVREQLQAVLRAAELQTPPTDGGTYMGMTPVPWLARWLD